MNLFKRVAQLIWVGSSVGGIAGTPNLVRGVGWGTSNKSVNLSELGLKEISEAGRSTRVCAKLDEEGNLVGLKLIGTSTGWWSFQKGGIAKRKLSEEDEKGIKNCDQSEDRQSQSNLNAQVNEVRSCSEIITKLNDSHTNRKKVLEELKECLQKKKEELLKTQQPRLKSGWSRVGKGYEIPLDGILKAGTGWTWHQKQIKVN